ncbi:NBR1-Ig-like domain-containing protein [Sinosporangium siamense]|uniref:Nbr1 FW domain-containing protein n=1 Tax=Sinosporangium siamense TaxID=1367973 RepID=A0A919V6P3_9ACTN|nr:NBR1-Ig-like domain-containing protein [Sinosporangium siamense]GII92206.1 hypothetical protein Ssi02_24370 [Sinosporangium siamense]
MAGSPEQAGGDTGAPRGRKPVRPDPRSGPVALLAHRLWELKDEAGAPSFAEMSSRLGAAASKSSLAAAARGQVLPTWETTWEFVRVLAVDRLGRDAEEVRREWRGHWESARVESEEPSVSPEAVAAPSAVTPEPAPVAGKRGSRAMLLALVSAGAVVGVVGGVLTFGNLAGTPSGTPSGREVQAEAVPRTETVPQDDSAFVGDITIPDGTKVERGQTFTKVWRLKNTGGTHWKKRFMTRTNNTPCEAPERVPVPATKPGETVDIKVDVKAAREPARCKIFWKMTNEEDVPVFAGKNPIFLDVTVK